jgi:hypothetical protein
MQKLAHLIPFPGPSRRVSPEQAAAVATAIASVRREAAERGYDASPVVEQLRSAAAS